MQPGTILGKRYRILERIGGGGMALVYRAEDIFLGRPVAVKVLRSTFGADEEFVRRFRREAQAVASLSHPNVVSIFDVGEEADLYYIVMELVEGRTLKDRITEAGSLPLDEAVGIALEILKAVAHAHAHKIVHRDIKPHNILLSGDGRVKVTDFGIARAVTTDTVTNTGSILGSAHYFSPEMARGKPAGEKSDLYSLGVVLYEMVTGRVPFQGESPISVALKHVQEEVLPPSVLNPEVPVELEEIILRALEKEPEDRYDSAEAMAADLERFRTEHRAGRTHRVAADYPTQDLRAVRDRYNDGKKAGAARTDEPEEERGRVRWGLWIALIVLLLLGGAVAGGFYLTSQMFDKPDVPVPDLRGMTVEEARRALEAQGLGLDVIGEEYHSLPAGQITWQESPPEMTVKQGRLIKVKLSKGARRVTVPDLSNMTQAEAEDELSRAGLKAVVHEMHSRDVTAGRVVRQDPLQGEQVQEGFVVDVWISQGPLLAPNLIGKTLDDARGALEAQGLALGDITPIDSAEPKDTVVDQDPRPASEVTPGAPISLVVSNGNAPAETQEVVKVISVPGETGTVMVKVVLLDTTGPARTIHEAEHLAGDQFPLPVRFIGPQAALQVYVDDVLAEEIPLP